MFGITLWRRWCFQLALASSVTVGWALAEREDCAFAQITPDSTLPNNSTITTQENTNLIEGGTQTGGNLFHSFEQFSVSTGNTAYFNNAADVQNIISRVTGASISNIDGLIRANGTANLFLINPNGIIFGPNASLNIGGSFMGTTASSLNFADGSQFSATAPQTTPLLTVSVPIGLQYGGNLVGIQVQQSILQVQPGRTLALMGGNVSVQGGEFGFLEVLGGRIELGGVTGAGTVGLNADGNNLSLSYPEGVQRADVSLDNGAFVNVAAGGGGSIAINAQNLNMAGRSTLRAGIDSRLGSVGSVAGDIEINARGTINLTNESLIANRVRTGAIGKGGSINITTGSLAVTNGALLSTTIYGQGDGGSVNINARDTNSFDGVSSNGLSSGAFSNVAPGAVGKGGDINVTAESLSASNGAQLSTAILGQGDGGSVNINVRDTISFDGMGSNGLSSGAFSTVNFEGMGKGGNINVTTGALFVTNGAGLSAGTFGKGDAGSVTIIARDIVSVDGINSNFRETFGGVSWNGRRSGVATNVVFGAVGNGGDISITTGSLSVTNGAGIAANSGGQGNSGSIKINARDTISIDGVNENLGLVIFGERFDNSRSGLSTQMVPGAVGNGGVINISAGSLAVTNGAVLIASNRGSGAAGNIEVEASSIRLDNQALLSSNTSAGQGNIFLDSQNLLLRRSSNITTNATGSATGGNITIDTGVIVALENSDISADAEESFGGRVIIDAQGIFGTEFREIENPATSDITATSDLGLQFSGTVEINTPDVDPNRGLVNLPTQPTSAEVVQACQPGGSQAQSEFIVTGRGGLPPTPGEALSTDTVQVNLMTLNPEATQTSTHKARGENRPVSATSTPSQLVEAQGWTVNTQGQLVLTASAPTATPNSFWSTPPTCNAL